MTYEIIITKSIQKQLDNLPNNIQERVYDKISQLAEEPRPDGVVKLKGYDNEYRIRIGDYRLVYEIQDEQLIVLIIQCKHRRDLYKKGSSVHSMQNQSQKTAEGLIYIRHKLQILDIFTKIASLPCSLFPVPCSLFPVPSFRLVI
jgi:mRNA interferase RelE/StbE